MNDKIMASESLENIMRRLSGCRALVNALYETAGTTAVSEAALSGIYDLLDGICRDFQADIDSADGREVGAA